MGSSVYVLNELSVIVTPCSYRAVIAACVCMQNIEVNVDALCNLDYRVQEALRGQIVGCALKYAGSLFPSVSLYIINRHLGEDIQTVAEGNGAACKGLKGEVCHLGGKVCVEIEVLLNAYDVSLNIVQQFAECGRFNGAGQIIGALKCAHNRQAGNIVGHYGKQIFFCAVLGKGRKGHAEK
jgi:hypothetical protein